MRQLNATTHYDDDDDDDDDDGNLTMRISGVKVTSLGDLVHVFLGGRNFVIHRAQETSNWINNHHVFLTLFQNGLVAPAWYVPC